MRRLFVPLACAALFPFAAGALAQPHSQSQPQPQPPLTGLTLEAAVQTALQHSPILRAYGLALESNDGAIRQAGLAPNPTLGLSTEDTRKETRTTSMTLSQTLELGGKRAARVELAQRDRDVAALVLEAQRADVRASTIQAFFDVLIAQERVQVAEASQAIAASGADAVSRRVTAGKVSPVEETRARVAASTARIEWRQAQADLAAALKALSAVMGEPQGAITRVEGAPDALPRLPDPGRLAERIDASPVLRRAQMEVQRAEAAFNLARARGVPDVTIGLGAQRAPEVGRTQPLISVSIPIPLFDRNQGAQFQALRQRDAAQALARAEALRLRAEVMQAADQLEARVDEIEALRRDVLPGAQIAYDAARRGFELGKFGFLDVLDAQRTFLQACGQYFTALSQAHRLLAEMDRRLGSADVRP